MGRTENLTLSLSPAGPGLAKAERCPSKCSWYFAARAEPRHQTDTDAPRGTMKLGCAQMRGLERVSGGEPAAGGSPEKAFPSSPPAPTQLLASPALRCPQGPTETHFWATLGTGRSAQPKPSRVTLGLEGGTHGSGRRPSGSETVLEERDNEPGCPPDP